MRSRSYFVYQVFYALLVFGFIAEVNSWFEFTNLKCNSLDKKFGDFEYCFLKSVNRSYKYASAKVNFYQLPITNANGHLALSKRLNGYKPFLYDLTLDICKFLRNPKAGNPVASFFYSLLRPYSNLNHSCPYNHDVYLEKVPISFLNHKFTEILPFPEGNYRISFWMTTRNSKGLNIEYYFTIS